MNYEFGITSYELVALRAIKSYSITNLELLFNLQSSIARPWRAHLSFIIFHFHLAELCFALTKRYIIIQFLQICLTWFQVLAFLRSFVKHWLTGFVVEDDAVGFCYHSEGIGNSEEGEMG